MRSVLNLFRWDKDNFPVPQFRNRVTGTFVTATRFLNTAPSRLNYLVQKQLVGNRLCFQFSFS